MGLGLPAQRALPDAGPTMPAEIVRESLPLAAQWGILGVLVLVFLAATVFLALRLDKARTDHAAILDKVRTEHKVEVLEAERRGHTAMNAVQEQRIRESGAFATALHEVVEPLAEAIDQVQTIAEDLREVADRERERTGQPSSNGKSTRRERT